MGKLCYFPLVQNPDEQWTQGTGRVTPQMIESFMPEPFEDTDDSLVVLCGPPKLKDSVSEIMSTMGWKNFFVYV